MEKVKYENNQTLHEFYCDECHKYLDYSYEYDDGYYEEFGETSINISTNDKYFVFEKHYCDECKKKKLEEFENMLVNFGFKSDN